MRILRRLLLIARPYAGRLVLVSVLTSLGALGELVEPWVYRAVINDIAGVFVSKETHVWSEIMEELRTGGVENDSDSQPATPEAQPGPPADQTGGQKSATPLPETPKPATENPAAPAPATSAAPPPAPYPGLRQGPFSTTANTGKSAESANRRSKGSASASPSDAAKKAAQKAIRRHSKRWRNRVAQEIKQQITQVTQPPAGSPPVVPPRTVSQVMRTLWIGVLILIVASVFSKFFSAGAELLAAYTTNEIEENFILKTLRHVLRLPFSFFTQRTSGSIARQVDQADQIAPLYGAITQEVWSELFTAITIIIVMLSVNLELSIMVLTAVLFYLLVTARMTQRLETHLESYWELWDDVSGKIHEVVAGIKTVRQSGNEDYELARTRAVVDNAFRTYLRRQRVETRYTFIQNLLIYSSKGLVLGVGGMRALQHQLTPGDVVMFMAYLDRIYSPVHNLTGLYTQIQRHVVSLMRAFRLQDLAEEGTESNGSAIERRPVVVQEARVEFRDVCFRYRPDRPLIEGLNLALEPGLVTALVGPSGAGKTTIADLIVQLYHPQRGSIVVDGQDLAHADLSSWRQNVSVVSPEGTIFHDTLAENIRYGRGRATEEQVRQAAVKAGLAAAIERLPEGLNSMLGERGYELSLGERQRVLLARAFLANPRLLILDEATANLDFKTEAAIKHTLRDLTRGRTTLIIAHRQSMMTEADRVIAIRDGRVIEEGTPEELLMQHGYFYQMMSAQHAPVPTSEVTVH